MDIQGFLDQYEGIPSGKKLRRYISAGQCPWCNSGKAYRSIASHTSRAHGITGYELREMAGLNRSSKICDPEYSVSRSEQQKETAKRNLGFLNYDRSKIASFRKRGLRSEGQEHWSDIARTPERRKVFTAAMAKVDRRAVAARMSPEVKSARSKEASAAFWRGKTKEQRQKHMAPALATPRTPESEKARIEHMQKTFKDRYWNDPEWRRQWHTKIAKAQQKRAKIPVSERPTIKNRYLQGESLSQLAEDYKVSKALIYLIISSQGEYLRRYGKREGTLVEINSPDGHL